MVLRKRRNSMSWMFLGFAVLALVVVLGFVAGSCLLIDDWSRDLTVNHAATVDDHRDQRLRPLILEGTTVAAVAQRTIAAAARLPRWEFSKRTEQPDGHTTLYLIRRTPLWQFADDVTVRLAPVGADVQVQVESQSRVGRADLGQNPRNIRELLDAIRNESP